MEDTGELDSDVASADNDSALRQLLKVEEAVRVEAVFVAGDVLREGRGTADSDDEAVRGELALLVRSAVRLRLGVRRDDGDSVLVVELGVASDVVHLVLLDVWVQTSGSITRLCRGRHNSWIR